MPCLLCVTGLSGVGKSTAGKFLARKCNAKIVYLGEYVLQELKTRGLSRSAENERSVRADLREIHGPEVFAKLGAKTILDFLKEGSSVVIDAIFHLTEYEHLKSVCSNFQIYLIGIEAGFKVRSDRL